MNTTKDSKDASTEDTQGPQVHVHSPDSVRSSGKEPQPLDGTLIPSTADEAGTQMSSSSGSAKPPSLDGKSVASGTTFALDEKESLRPDDSASVKATEDEESYAFSTAGLPASRTGSDDGVRAFRDQLREISSIQPQSATGRPQIISHGGRSGHGVLYVPPEGSGVGVVPAQGVRTNDGSDNSGNPPDPKLLEALDSPKDRIMVLKLEQDIVDFVKDAKESSLTLPQTNAFYRMLAHRLADYYMLGHVSDETTNAVKIYKTPDCRLPPPLTLIATPSTAASTPPPGPVQMKILRRGADGSGLTIANGSNAASDIGDGGSEDARPKLPPSREEREAKYEEARKRIMGSARPSDSPEGAPQIDESRASSASGKKNKPRKQRNDSDDDFEARSAYSAYYPQSFAQTSTAPGYGYPAVVDSQVGQYPPSPYNVPDGPQGYGPYGAPATNPWMANQFGGQQQQTNSWAQGQQSGYDLSGNFQRAMNLQAPVPGPTSGMQPGYNQPYHPQYTAQQQQWPQQPAFMPGYPAQQNMPPNYAPQQQPGGGPMGTGSSYAYGQLPSQAFPGRPASKLEHPLPGSYRSKHFNPQSQTFIPGHGPQTTSSPHAFVPPSGPYMGDSHRNGYGLPYPPQRQSSASSHNGSMGSPHPMPNPTPGRGPAQPMVHPLPQPVFPHQPSPNVPLPPKPAEQITKLPTPDTAGNKQSQSTIAKWGTPASLPAKPPPPSSAEPFRAGGGMPTFGSMPPPTQVASGYTGSGQGR